MSARWRTAWITGASTGIGRELALELAAAGVKVAATARNAEALADLAALSPNISVHRGDVTDIAEMRAIHRRIGEAIGPIDLAILNAGVWDQSRASHFDAGRAARTMSVNYFGLANALELLIADMVARRSGHVALVSSVAGYRGLPLSVYYAPSKAAVISLAEVLRCELSRHGIAISVVNPGFVETPMTAANDFPMPYIMKAEEAARRILRGLEKGKFEIAFPWQMVAMLKLARVLPYPAYFWVVRNLIASGSGDDRSKLG